MTYIDLIATVTGHRVVVIPLLSIDHELEFRELFRNGLCFLRANFLTASEAGIRVLFLFVEGVLAEARAAHTRNRIIHINLGLAHCRPNRAIVVCCCYVCSGAAWV